MLDSRSKWTKKKFIYVKFNIRFDSFVSIYLIAKFDIFVIIFDTHVHSFSVNNAPPSSYNVYLKLMK